MFQNWILIRSQEVKKIHRSFIGRCCGFLLGLCRTQGKSGPEAHSNSPDVTKECLCRGIEKRHKLVVVLAILNSDSRNAAEVTVMALCEIWLMRVEFNLHEEPVVPPVDVQDMARLEKEWY